MDDRAIVKSNFSDNQINTIKNTVAKGATNDELKMFIHLCNTYDLDPFAKEIWFIKYRDQTSIITSRDGYLKIANRNSHFKGMSSDVVYSGDKFIKTKDGVQHAYGISNRGKPVGAYALVYRDDRDIPAYFYAPISDYGKNSGVWGQYPHAMILKVAEAMALKRAFSISGLTTQEELGSDNYQPVIDVQPVHNKRKLTDIYNRYLAVCDNQKNHALNAIKLIIGDTPSSQLSDEQINSLEEDLKSREMSQFINNSPAFKQEEFQAQEQEGDLPFEDNSVIDNESE